MKEINFLFKSPLFFISMATAAKCVLPIPIFWDYLVPLDVDVTGNITAKLCEVWSEFRIFCTLVTKESKFFVNPPFFVSMATAAKFVQPIPLFFARCGCCCYQVSLISVLRVTCYDHFCVFNFFCILTVSMATAAILKKSTLKAQFHMAYDILTRFHQI